MIPMGSKTIPYFLPNRRIEFPVLFITHPINLNIPTEIFRLHACLHTDPYIRTYIRTIKQKKRFRRAEHDYGLVNRTAPSYSFEEQLSASPKLALLPLSIIKDKLVPFQQNSHPLSLSFSFTSTSTSTARLFFSFFLYFFQI